MCLIHVQAHISACTAFSIAVSSTFIWKLALLLATMKGVLMWLVALWVFINRNDFILNQLDSCFVLSLLLNKSKGNVHEGI